MAFFNKFFQSSAPKPVEKVTPAAQVHSGAAATPAGTAATTTSTIRHKIAIASAKGGVGKSTVTSNLAFALAKAGAKVGVLDADIYGPSQPTMLGGESELNQGRQTPEGKLIPAERQGVKFISMGMFTPQDGPVVWRAPMAMKMLSQFLNSVDWGDLDYLLMDLPPGTGDVQLTLAQQAQLSGAVIVTTPQHVALGVTKKGLKMFQQVNVPILGLIENMSGFTCSHCEKETAIFKSGGGRALAQEARLPFLGSIPLDPAVMMSADEGKSLFEVGPDSHAAKAFGLIASQLESRIVSSAPGAVLIEPSRAVVTDEGALEITWQDGSIQRLSGQYLRQNCGCATCIDENTGRRLLDPSTVKPEMAVKSLAPVGRYAFQLAFSDGHSTGLFPFKKLKSASVTVSPAAVESIAVAAESAAPVLSSEQMAAAVTKILEEELNPSLAGHSGRADLVEVRGATVYLRMSGGCQGCSGAQATLRQGIEKVLKAKVPGVKEIIDVTDHAAGTQPFLSL